MTARSTPVPQVVIDAETTAARVIDLDHFARMMESEPFVRRLRVAGSQAVLDLLPRGAVVERCVTTDSWVRVMARCDGATVRVVTDSTGADVQVSSALHETAELVAAEIRQRGPEPSQGEVALCTWYEDPRSGVHSVERQIETPAWTEISRNYPQATRRRLASLMALERPERTGKLILWHGPPGTGKTTAVRALMRSWAPWCVAQYVADPDRFFASTGYITSVLSSSPTSEVGPTLSESARPGALWRLVIAEDADEYVRASARHDAGSALGRLLNLTDGLLGQGNPVLVLLTTNEPVGRLHPALVRPGRCMAAVEFPPFEAAAAQAWLGEAAKADGPTTLAELLELRGDLDRIEPEASERPAGLYL